MRRIRTFCTFFLFLAVLSSAFFLPPAVSNIRDRVLFGTVATQKLEKQELPDEAIMDVTDKIALISRYNAGEEGVVMISQDQQTDVRQKTEDIASIVEKELEKLKNIGLFPQIAIDDHFSYLLCTMKTYMDTDRPGISATIWDMTISFDDNIVSLLIDADTNLIYQFSVSPGKPPTALPEKEIPQKFADYLGIVWDTTAIYSKPGVAQYSTDGGKVVYQFVWTKDGKIYSVQIIPNMKGQVINKMQ